jgi:hypothetical protein
MLTDTSYDAFQKVRPNVTKSQAAVLKVIREHPEGLTDAEINYYLGWTINRVTPRRNELMERQKGDPQNRTRLGLIYDAGIRPCRVTKSSAHAWKARVPVLPAARETKVPKANEYADEQRPLI